MRPASRPGSARTWTELHRVQVYERFGRGIDEVTYRLPSGQDALFTLYTQRPTVAVLGLTEEGLVIVTRQFRPGPQQFVYELPGGYLDDGDGPIDAGARELREETGYASPSLRVAGWCYADSYSTGVKYCLLGENCVLTGDQELESEEFVDVLLLSPAEFRRLLRSGQVIDVDLAFLALDAAGLL